MMGSFDVGMMMLGMFSVLAQLSLVVLALGCGARSLFLLVRRPDEAHRGQRWALIAIGFGLAVETWTIVFFTPWQFPDATNLHWIPLPAFLIGGCALVLWRTHDSRRWSSTGRLMIVIAVVTVAIGVVLNLQSWDHRRFLLHQASLNDQEARSFLEASEAERRCLEHVKQRETCNRCKSRRPDEYFVRDALKYAKLRTAAANAYRRAADQGEEPSLPFSVD